MIANEAEGVDFDGMPTAEVLQGSSIFRQSGSSRDRGFFPCSPPHKMRKQPGHIQFLLGSKNPSDLIIGNVIQYGHDHACYPKRPARKGGR